MKHITAAFLSMVFLCGCLPPGNPPAGNITENIINIPADRNEIRENLITEISAFILTYAPGENFILDYDETSAADILIVWHECAKLTGSKRVAAAEWKIISRNINGNWNIKLMQGKNIVANFSRMMPLF